MASKLSPRNHGRTAARTFTAGLNPNLYKILYLHWTSGSASDLLRQIALELDLEPAHYRGDLVRQISQAIVHLNQSKKQHPILICDEAQLLRYPALEQLPLLLNFDMDSSHYLTLLLVGEPLLRRTLSLQMHEPLRQRIAVQYHLDGLSREELDAYLTHQLKTAGVSQPLLDETARQALYQATKGILRKVNKLVLTALRLAATRKAATVNEAILLDATSEALLRRTPRRRRFSRWRNFWNDSRPLRRRAWWNRASYRCRASCLSAGSRRSANPCWWRISRFRWRPALIGWAFRYRLRAACSFASSSCPSRSLSAVWQPCGM